MESCTGQEWPRRAIFFLHYLYPLLTIFYFLLTRTISAFALRRLSSANTGRSFRPGYPLWFTLGLVATYVGETTLAFTENSGLPSGRVTQDLIVYTVSSSIIWAVQAVSLLCSKHTTWHPYYGCWAIAVAAEILLTTFEHMSCPPTEPTEFSQLGIQTVRLCALSLLLGLFFSARTSGEEDTQVDAESQSLLAGKARAPNGAKHDANLSLAKIHDPSYGGVHIASTDDESASNSQNRQGSGWTAVWDMVKYHKKAPHSSKSRGTSRSTVRDILNLFLFVWPTGRIWLQLSFIGIGLCVLAGRVLKVLVLYQLGKAIDILSNRPDRLPWFEISLYVLYRWLDSSAGLGFIKRLLLARVEEHSYKSVNIAAFGHLMELSSDSYEHSRWRKVLDSVNYGRTITRLVDVGTFEVIPTFIDILVIIGFLSFLFDAYLGLMVAVVSVTFLWMTSGLYKVEKDKRGLLNKTAELESRLISQVINAWQTVLIYNQASYEMKRYSNAVERHTNAIRNARISHCVLLAIQGSIICIGLLATSLFAANQLVQGHKPFGNFVILLVYWMGMSGTLYSMSLNWRCLKDDLVVARGFLALFQTNPTVRHQATAQRLELTAGEVQFEDVSFGYEPEDLILKNISFLARPNQKVALVGLTETGKSTILKLLFRLYDVTNGRIEIDGQDLRNITIDSLREVIGVISNDCELFNDSILNNIRYARLGSPDQDVFNACETAGIHQKILTFSDGYNTRLGEHGSMLSGSDLKRISIARAFLKDPKILLLDEPISWCDGEPEIQIQNAIAELTRGRTTLIAARQQSTMVDADLVLVLKDGRIAEQGYHSQLLRKKGVYSTMWGAQNATKALTGETMGLLTMGQVEAEDNSLQPLNSDLAHKAAAVLEDNQSAMAVTDDINHAYNKPTAGPDDHKTTITAAHDVKYVRQEAPAVLEGIQSKKAAADGLHHTSHKAATVPADNRINKAASHGLKHVNDKPAAVRGDNHTKNAIVRNAGQTKVNDPVGRWRPDAPEFIPRNMHILIPNKDSPSKGKGIIKDVKPVGREDKSKSTSKPQTREKIIQMDHKNETGINLKKNEIRQNLSDITNGKSTDGNISQTKAMDGQSDIGQVATRSNETERATAKSESNKEGGNVVDAKGNTKEEKPDMVNGDADTIEVKKDENTKDRPEVDKEIGNAAIINDDDSEPKQSDIQPTNKPADEPEVQAVLPTTDSSGDRVDGNKEPADTDVKKPKRRRSRNKNRSKRRQKSTSEESASRGQEENLQNPSKVETSHGGESTKVDESEKATSNPTEQSTEENPPVKRVHFRRGPQSQSEPSREADNDSTKPLRSSMRSFGGHLLGAQDRRESASSDVITGKSGPSRKRSQRFKDWKGKKQNGKKASGDIQKVTKGEDKPANETQGPK